MRRPSDSHAPLWSAQAIRHALLTTGKDQRQRPRPELRGERRGVSGQVKPEASDHLTFCDEEQEWLSGRAALEGDELLDRAFIDRAAESVHGLCWVRQDFSCGEMSERSIDGSLDFLRRPERHHHRLGVHSRKILSASANAKSVSSVILTARSLPRTPTTGRPICSQSAASSVATRSASRASRCARSTTCRGKACEVWARHSPKRSTVSTTLPLESTRFSVSATGNAATAPFPFRASSMTRPIVSPDTSGRAAS